MYKHSVRRTKVYRGKEKKNRRQKLEIDAIDDGLMTLWREKYEKRNDTGAGTQRAKQKSSVVRRLTSSAARLKSLFRDTEHTYTGRLSISLNILACWPLLHGSLNRVLNSIFFVS